MITQQELRPVDQSDNTFIQALLFETAFQPGTVITYVLQGNPGDTDPYGGALWATDDRAEAFALALAAWSNVANISFVQSDVAYDGTGSTSAFDWIETLEDLEEGILGQHNLPFAGVMEGNFSLAAGIFSGAAIMPGGLGFSTLVHEIGHGIGLLHPHQEGDSGWDFAFPGVTDPFDTGTFGLNQGPFTVMTYNSGYLDVGVPLTNDMGYEAGPGAFDIAAVQYLYGANLTYNTGNDTYELPDQNVAGTGWTSIWDAGGTDTISAAGSSLNAYIDLREATLQLEPGGGGFVSRVEGILGGVTIANGVVIENAIGGNGDDFFVTNAAANVINGGNGFDLVDYTYDFYDLHDYSDAEPDLGMTINLATGVTSGDVNDTLVGIEHVRSGDGNDILTASNQTTYVMMADFLITDPLEHSGNSLQTALDLTPYFDNRATSQASAPAATANHLVATVQAVGRTQMDFFSFTLGTAAAGTQIIIDIDSTFSFDPVLRLLDAQGNVLATNDDIGPQLDTGSASPFDSYLTYNLPANLAADTVFFVELGAYSQSGTTLIPAGAAYTMHVVAVAEEVGDALRFHSILEAGNGVNTLIGGAGNDLMIGGDSSDSFYASAGIDVMNGGSGGADTYYILGDAGTDDVIIETQSGDHDKVVTDKDYQLGALIENLELVAGAAVYGIGNASDNEIIGNANANHLIGLEGHDTIHGGDGNDIIEGGAGRDKIYGEGGNNALYGGADDDDYFVSGQGDLIFEEVNGGAEDWVSSSGSFYLYANVEHLTLSGTGNNFGVGNDLNNDIYGNSGDNLLIGGLGADYLRGYQGNDLLYGEDGDDVLAGLWGVDYIVGGEGNDELSGGQGADALYGGNGDDVLAADSQTGYHGAWIRTGASIPPPPPPDFVTDILVGGAGNDTLYGNSGLGDYDLLYGNTGNDTFYVDTPDDLVFEEAGEGYDVVYAGIEGAGYYLYANIEELILTDETPFGVGNELNNVLTGNAIGNYLLGGAGNDTLNGKAGNDVLFGEAGADTFIFEVGTGGDVIGDFASGEDVIDLQAFEIASFAALQTLFVQNGDVGAINLNGDLVVLHNVQMDQLTADDFLL